MYKNILILLGFFSLFSCTKETIYPTPCNGDCETSWEVVYKNQFVSPNNNGYYEIQWDDLDYFQIQGSLTPLNDEYVINGVPLVESSFDSDYWIIMDSIQFQTPMYSYLGWFNDDNLENPIPIGNYVYTMSNLMDIHPPTNIAGYQIPENFCSECPYATTLLGSHSKYNYSPRQNFMLDNEMIGDTINVFTKTLFNSDMGENEIIENNIKIIIL